MVMPIKCLILSRFRLRVDGSVIKSIIPSPEQQPRLTGWGIVTKESEAYEFDEDGYLDQNYQHHHY